VIRPSAFPPTQRFAFKHFENAMVAVLSPLCYRSCALEARVARLLSLNHLQVKSPAFSFFAVSLA
jgi:hypothetical protein